MKTHTGLTICSAGDTSFRGRYEDDAADFILQNLEFYFKQADFAIINLESPLVEKKSVPVPGKCTLRGATGWASTLKKSGIHLVTLANNHMMDYGEKGLLSTIEALHKADIDYVGAGKDSYAACKPLYEKTEDSGLEEINPDILGVRKELVGFTPIEVPV